MTNKKNAEDKISVKRGLVQVKMNDKIGKVVYTSKGTAKILVDSKRATMVKK